MASHLVFLLIPKLYPVYFRQMLGLSLYNIVAFSSMEQVWFPKTKLSKIPNIEELIEMSNK